MQYLLACTWEDKVNGSAVQGRVTKMRRKRRDTLSPKLCQHVLFKNRGWKEMKPSPYISHRTRTRSCLLRILLWVVRRRKRASERAREWVILPAGKEMVVWGYMSRVGLVFCRVMRDGIKGCVKVKVNVNANVIREWASHV